MNISHHEMVAKLMKPGAEVLASMNEHDANLLHCIIGLSGEVGELLDAIKKAVIYREPLDDINVLEELGDIEFYLEAFRQAIGVSRSATLAANVDKLGKRYEGMVYTDKRAQDRADKQEVQL